MRLFHRRYRVIVTRANLTSRNVHYVKRADVGNFRIEVIFTHETFLRDRRVNETTILTYPTVNQVLITIASLHEARFADDVRVRI